MTEAGTRREGRAAAARLWLLRERSWCPTGTVCVSEIGGVAGGGGSFCSPIPEACHGHPSCACMETCACAHFSFTNQACYDQDGSIACDNGVR